MTSLKIRVAIEKSIKWCSQIVVAGNSLIERVPAAQLPDAANTSPGQATTSVLCNWISCTLPNVTAHAVLGGNQLRAVTFERRGISSC